MNLHRDFPGGQGVTNPPPGAGEAVGSLAGELRSHMPHGAAKKSQEKKNIYVHIL